MDWTSLIGLLIALAAIILGQIFGGGQIQVLLQPSAFIIVFAGTFGAVLLQTPAKVFFRGLKLCHRVFTMQKDMRLEFLNKILYWSMLTRREGFLVLEKEMEQEKDPFIAKGLRLLVDGFDAPQIKEIMLSYATLLEREQRLSARIWDSAGGYAPTIGILGAVLGLIHVMGNLSDPSKLGSGIAVAFVATIYGIGFANLFFLPIANKLKALIELETHTREMLVEAFCAISTGDHPRVIEERIAGYL